MRGYDQWKTASPYDDCPEPSDLVDSVLEILEEAGVPQRINDKIVSLVEDWEHGTSGVDAVIESIDPSLTAYGLYKAIYKGTDCGPSIGLLPVGDDSKWLYNSDLRNERPAMGAYQGISVSSIVEGSDAEIPPVEFIGDFDPKDFWEAVEKVNAQATEVWEEYHCQKCGGELGFTEELICDECSEISVDGDK